jgi:hypothetical protein
MAEFGVVRTGLGGRSLPLDTLLVFTRAADMEISDLSLRMAALDLSLTRLDADRCLDSSVRADPKAGTLALNGTSYRPRLAWLRHFDLEAIPSAQPPVSRAYAVNAWNACRSWATNSPSWSHLNPGAHNLDRLSQIEVAQQHGFSVPHTALVTVPGDAVQVLGRSLGDIAVLKPVGHHFLEPTPGRLRGLFAQYIDVAKLAELPPEPAPLLVQQYIASEYELRIFVVGSRYIGFRVYKACPSDVWKRPETVRVERASVPRGALARLRRLTAIWQLDIAAFDLLVTKGGCVFLEVNTDCDWLWFEQRADCDDVSTAVLDHCTGRLRALSQ